MSPDLRRLEVLMAEVRAHLNARAALAVAVWAASGIAGVLLAAWLLAGSGGWRAGSEGPLLFDACIVVLLVAAAWLFRRGSTRWFHEVPLSASVERAAGLQQGVVRGSLELGRSVPSGVSPALAGSAARSAMRGLEGRSAPALAGGLGERVTRATRSGLGALAGAVVVLLTLAVAAPERSAAAWGPLGAPLRTLADPVLAPIVLTPGTVEVLRGSDVRVTVTAPGRLEAVLWWQAAGEVARSETLALAEGRGSWVFRDVRAPIEYRAHGDLGSVSATYRIVPVDPLFISELTVDVEYPAHTGLPPDEHRGDPPPLRLPEGTRLRFEGRASRPLSTAALLDSAGAPALALTVDGATFQGAWLPQRDGTFPWAFQDEAGEPAEIQPTPLIVSLVADSAPRVTIPLPGADTVLPLSLRQPLVIEARDDYGLGRLELVAYRVTAFGERREPVVQGIDLGGTRAALARPLLDLRAWGLLPGDTVRYFARAADNAPAAHVTTTREYVLRMPAASELQREAERQLDAVAERLQELAEEAGRQAEENRDQAREAAGPEETRRGIPDPSAESEAGFEERERLQQALEEQGELTGEVDSLRAELEELERMMREAGQADPGLTEKLEELQDLLRQMTDDGLRQRMDELARALDREDLSQANRTLEELAQQQEELRQRLEESLERFRRAAAEQDLRATTSEAEELARQERALADALREQDDPELRAGQQEELSERAEALEQRLRGLEERLRELEEPAAADAVREARETSEAAQGQMQQAQRQASQGQSSEAGERADEAAEQLEQAAEQLEQAQQEMAEQQAEAVREALRRTADDALALARRQSELRERMRGGSQEQVAAMRADEASLLRGLENMAGTLQEETQGAMEGNRELSAQIGRAMESIQNTLESMEGRRGSTPSPYAQAEQAVGELNQLALMAMAGAEQMGQSGEGQTGEQVSEQLEQLAQQQGELMNQAAQLMPLQLGQQAMAEQLQQMSQGQESVASDLGDLADEPGAEQSLGDLEQLAEEARALAQQLAQGRLTPDVTQRQERLFHRLLDAGRSLEREEYSDQRESERVSEFERGVVTPLTAEQMGALRFRLPDAAQLQLLSPAVRQLVLQYFERLNRGGGSEGGLR